MSSFLALPLALAIAAAPAATAAPGCEEAPEPVSAWCASLAERPRLPLPTQADRHALRTVFERPELRRARADTAGFRRLLMELWGRALEFLGTTEAERFAGAGRLVFIVAGLAAALAGLAALRRRKHAPAPGVAEAAQELARLPAPDLSAARADAALARGDPTGAVRHAFLSALAALEAAGRIPRDRTLTNSELTARLAVAGGSIADDFGALGRLFDGAVYGGVAVRDPEARSGVAVAARIRERSGGVR